MSAVKSNVIRLYDVKPELALEHLKRSTGLDFDELPENLADRVEKTSGHQPVPPVLTDIVDEPVFSKA
ncbi:hypothetical protein [Reinekea blandensis]|uniref:Uncharacterized protein n=1 Tax=Reinekea blandensis MED297 TaxID=314283 RepID=A4BAF1_9GAMM|nr:hypothetical protein [Reinekea blandensis]EAR10907.1 hypothetical protein MED297_10366 [Reinekea sp. MED297] [Reinekea blandensis MED297]